MLEAILENIPVGLAVTGGAPDFETMRVSRHGWEMNGRTEDASAGSPSPDNAQAQFARILLPDQQTELSPEQMPLYRASRLGEEARNVELVMQTPQGKRIPVLVNAAPIHDIQGRIVAAISTWLDITDRKLAEETLQASEALYRAIARSIPRGGIFVVDRHLRFVIAEGTIAEKFGASKEMVEGHLNPYYREKSRLVGKHVIVVDDVTTYGLSFGVAAGFLRKAGAADVTGAALGKFGNQLRQYNVVIHSDPFAPVKPGNYSGGEAGWLSGATNSASQGALLTLIP